MIRTNTTLLDYISGIRRDNSEAISCYNFPEGTRIVEQQKRLSFVYIVKKGVAKCFLTEENGKDFIQEFFGEGEVFGEIEALNDKLSFCAVTALTDTEVYQIPRTNFLKLLDEDKVFNRFIMNAIAGKVHYKALRHAHNQLHAIEENVQRLQKQFPRLLEVIPKKDIANYLGVTLRSLNRVLSESGKEKF